MVARQAPHPCANRQSPSSPLMAMVVMLLFLMAPSPTQASIDASVLKRYDALLQKRASVQQQIHKAEQQLHKVQLERKDKLEELGELYRAQADVDKRRQFSKDIDNEIADETRNLHKIEEQRSDCLEELDGLYHALSQLDRDIAESSRELR